MSNLLKKIVSFLPKLVWAIVIFVLTFVVTEIASGCRHLKYIIFHRS